MDKKHNYTNHGKSSKRLWITFLYLEGCNQLHIMRNIYK